MFGVKFSDFFLRFLRGGTTSNLAFMLTVDVKSPYKTVAELTEAMKKKGDKASYATTANPGVIMGAIYRNAAGLSAVDVPYRTSADSLNEIMSGRIDYALHDPIFALAQAREGRLRILAVSTAKRLLSQPDIPTMTESGVPMDLALWWGVVPVRSEFAATTDEMIIKGDELLKRRGLAASGDKVVMLAGQSHTAGATNMLRVHTIS